MNERCRTSAVGLVVAALWLAPAAAEEAEPLPACRAAQAAPSYDPVLPLPPATLALIEAYREEWREVCAGKRQNGALHDLLAQANQIEVDVDEALDRWQEESTPEAESLAALDRILRVDLPRFVPGFEGAFAEYVYFRPSLTYFREHRSLGDEHDRRFLDSGIPLAGTSMLGRPWFRLTWDYGGCYRFGEFDWVAELEKMKAVQHPAMRRLYQDALREHHHALFLALTPTSSPCVCGDARGVLTDLEAVRRYLGPDAPVLQHIDELDRKIRDGTLTPRSNLEAHCGGG